MSVKRSGGVRETKVKKILLGRQIPLDPIGIQRGKVQDSGVRYRIAA